MTRYDSKTSLLFLSFTLSILSHHTTTSFQTHLPNTIITAIQRQPNILASVSATYDDGSNGVTNGRANAMASTLGEGDISLGEKVRTVTVAYMDQLTQINDDNVHIDDSDNNNNINNNNDSTSAATSASSTSIADTKGTPSSKTNQRERIVLDVIDGQPPTFTYEVTLPIVGTIPQAIGAQTNILTTSVDLSQTLGLTLNQVEETYGGRYQLSQSGLELDSLRYISLEEQTIADKKYELSCTFQEEGVDGSIQLVDEGLEGREFDIDGNRIDNNNSKSQLNSSGVVAARVVRGGLAWNAGIRAGDKIIATSATVGNQIWPKSTLEGIRSAISSRKVMFPSTKFQLQRSCENLVSEAELVQEFELSLSRPMGIHIEDTLDGYVQISGFTVDAPDTVTKKLQIGDRIIAVDSSLGNKLWPISNVDGAVSAVTTRLPGQPVRLRFERVVEKGTDLSSIESLKDDTNNKQTSISRNNQSLAKDLLATYTKYQSQDSSSTASLTENGGLLSRCRDVLKRYIYVHDANCEKSAGVPALVADRVVEALAAASASFDAKTLSLLMNAYIISKKPLEALRVFEASVGFAADGSSKETNVVIEGKKDGQIELNEDSLNLYTATDLIRAHSLLGDAASARRVLSAVEGDEAEFAGIKALNWNAKFKPDTKCYNTVLAAVSDSRNVGVEVAEELYESMCEPVLFSTPRPKKDVVTYNTMISVFARCGKRSDAFALLNEMLEVGFKPDKYTITSLVQAVVEDGDTETALNLLADMKKAGIQSDVVGYNNVIQSLCSKSQWFEAKSLVADMESRGISPDAKTYGLLMNGLLKLNKPGPCLTLFESACADQGSAALMENVQLYTTAITAAATLGDHERALELVSRMTFAGVKPNIKTLTSLMGACLSGENYNYALEVYKKIDKPDGLAMMFGVRAQSEIHDFDSAINIVDGNKEMSGKQVMSSYNYIITCALEERNYDAAQNAMDNLLKNNYIPSKITFMKILDGLDMRMSKEKRAAVFGNQSDDESEDIEKFKYLLTVLDAIEKRKLYCTGLMYSCILSEGARLGGLYKKIASLINKSHADASHLKVQVQQEEVPKYDVDLRWRDLLDNYSNYKSSLDKIELPPIRVRINQKEIRQVLFAEQRVTYGAIRKSTKRNFAQSKR